MVLGQLFSHGIDRIEIRSQLWQQSSRRLDEWIKRLWNIWWKAWKKQYLIPSVAASEFIQPFVHDCKICEIRILVHTFRATFIHIYAWSNCGRTLVTILHETGVLITAAHLCWFPTVREAPLKAPCPPPATRYVVPVRDKNCSAAFVTMRQETAIPFRIAK